MKPFMVVPDENSRSIIMCLISPKIHFLIYLFIAFTYGSFIPVPARSQETRTFVDAMVNLNDDWEFNSCQHSTGERLLA